MTDVRLSGFSVCKEPTAQPLLSWRSLLLRFLLRRQESFKELDEQVRKKKKIIAQAQLNTFV